MHLNQFFPLVSVLLATHALAGEHRYPLAPAYVTECGSCHVAYPPALLDAPGWALTLRDIDRHFGSDASLDAKTQREIAALLQAQASTRRKHEASGKTPRLSETAWFLREHRAEKLRKHGTLPPTTGSSGFSMAQCNACHSRASQGDYNESTLQAPQRPNERRQGERS